MVATKPKLVVSISQENGYFAIVGNREGLQYLSNTILKLIDPIDTKTSSSCNLDIDITHDLRKIIVGESEVESEINIIEFYNSSAKRSKNKYMSKTFEEKTLLLIKIIWLYLLPGLGVWQLLQIAGIA